MKTQQERVYPVLLDIGTQLEREPHRDFIFFYDDGQVYRAFPCDDITVDRYIVSAISDNRVIVKIPADTSWRLLKKDRLEFVSGAEMDEADIKNLKAKKDQQKKLVKEAGEDVKHEYSEGFNPKLYT